MEIDVKDLHVDRIRCDSHINDVCIYIKIIDI